MREALIGKKTLLQREAKKRAAVGFGGDVHREGEDKPKAPERTYAGNGGRICRMELISVSCRSAARAEKA